MLLKRFTPAVSRMQRLLAASGLIGAVGSSVKPYTMTSKNRMAPNGRKFGKLMSVLVENIFQRSVNGLGGVLRRVALA